MPHPDSIILARKLGLGLKLPKPAHHQAGDVAEATRVSALGRAEVDSLVDPTAPTADNSPPPAVGAPSYVILHKGDY